MSWVYQSSNSQEAHLRVYITDKESEADIVVILVPNVGQAVGLDHWFVDDYKQAAHTWLYFAKSQSEADFTVCFTRDESKAGIRIPNDKYRFLR